MSLSAPAAPVRLPQAPAMPAATLALAQTDTSLHALKDQLLLSLRDGAWCSVATLLAQCRRHIPDDAAVARCPSVNGSSDTTCACPATEGANLILADAVALCCQEQLAETRTSPAGDAEVRATPRQDSRFEILPLFRDWIPRSADEDQQLLELLLREDCRDPILVWRSRRLLVDGHTRFGICSLLGRPYAVEYKEFASESEVCAYIERLHYGRRSYNELLKSHVRGNQFLALRQPRGGSRRGSKCPTTTLIDMANAVADRYQVDRRTVYKDAHFVRALNLVLAACGTTLRPVILSGRIKRTTKSYVVRLAQQPPRMLRRLVEQALQEGRWPPLPSAAESTRKVALRLPVGDPQKQAMVLLKGLGAPAMLPLAEALLHLNGRDPRATEGPKPTIPFSRFASE